MAGAALTISGVAPEAVLGGRISIVQPPRGYRVPIDAWLLAAFVGPCESLLFDLGAGVGAVTLALTRLNPSLRAVAVERESQYAQCLRTNVSANGVAERVLVAECDVVDAARARRGSARVVVANPPYWASGATTEPDDPLREVAHIGDDGSGRAGAGALGDFTRAARLALGRRGRVCFVWPAGGTLALFDAAAAQGLHAKRARFVHPRMDRVATRVLAEFRAGRAGGLAVEPPLALVGSDGRPTVEADSIAQGLAFDPR